MTRSLAFALVVASLGIATRAEAEEIEYVAPAECPPRASFLAEISSRSSAEGDTRSYRAIIGRRTGGYVGRLEIDGVPRETRAATCAEVVKTLAVFVVIARTPSAEPETPTETPPEAPPAPKPKPTPPPRRTVPAPPPAPLPKLRYDASLRLAARLPSISGPVGDEERVQGEVAWLLPVVAPRVRLSYGTAGFGKDVDAGSVAFRFRTVRLEGCGGVELPRHLTVLPCLGGEAGDLVATTSNLPVPVRASTRWNAFTAGFGFRWAPRPWLFVGAELTALVPVSRRKFGLVDPVRLVYAVPAAYFDLGGILGVGARFD